MEPQRLVSFPRKETWTVLWYSRHPVNIGKTVKRSVKMFPLQEWLNKVTLGRAVPFKGSFPFQAPCVKNSMCKILVSAPEFSVNRRLEVFQLISDQKKTNSTS